MTNLLISAIRVRELFGLYTYAIPEQGELTSAAILYGDNGLGKSTILRLAFHLLSAANNRSHRSAIYRIPFRRFEVDLASAVTLVAERKGDDLAGVVSLSVIKSGAVAAIWDFEPKNAETIETLEGRLMLGTDAEGRPILLRASSEVKEDSIPRGEKAYLAALKQVIPSVFILNAERRLDSDTVADPSDEVELRKVMRFDEPKRIYDLLIRAREIALSQAISTMTRWINGRAFQAANQGSMNVHGVYTAVLKHLTSASAITATPTPNPDELIKQLAEIEAKSNKLAEYEFTAEIQIAEFRRALTGRASKKKELAAKLLQPYVKSLESRLNALSDIYHVVDQFVSIVNQFLSDKYVSFKATSGFQIQNRLGSKLEVSQLSSGEQQLLLLFCYVLVNRDTPSVFMIDEPEISLNVKWQRRLVQSLLDITSGSTVQFIFASHSLELLTQHRNRVIKLAGA